MKNSNASPVCKERKTERQITMTPRDLSVIDWDEHFFALLKNRTKKLQRWCICDRNENVDKISKKFNKAIFLDVCYKVVLISFPHSANLFVLKAAILK